MEGNIAALSKKNSILRDKLLSLVGVWLTVITIFSGVALFGFGASPVDIEFYGFFLLIPFITGVAFVLVGELFVDRKSFQSGAISNAEKKEIVNEIAQFKNTLIEMSEITAKQLSNNASAQLNLTPEEKESLFDRLSEDIKSNISGDELSETSAEISNSRKHDDALSFSNEFRGRLLEETDRLSRRANTNLFIGSITSVAGIAFLAYIFLNGQSYNIKLSEQGMSLEIAEYALYYIPRVTLVIFIEIFSYFFLKLYKGTLEDIKYYHNELTNIDSHLSALRLALLLGDTDSIKKVAVKLLGVERNFILKKGDTTVQLEVAKTESRKSSEALKMFEGLFKETKGLILSSKGSNK